MILFALQSVRARRGQALTVFLLVAAATGAAVLAPAALSITDRVIVRDAVAAAPTAERTLTLYSVGIPVGAGGGDFERFGPNAVEPTGFGQVYLTQLIVMVLDGSPADPTLMRLQYREDVCAHLTIVTGRCLMGTYEIVLGADTARALGLGPGSVLDLDGVILPEQGGVLRAADDPRRMMVVGTYRPTRPADAYWTEPSEFRANTSGAVDEPVFTTGLTARYSTSRLRQQAVVAIMPPEALGPGNLGAVESSVDAVRTRSADAGVGAVTVTTGIPELISRIETRIAAVHTLAPFAFVPLIALILYVTYLAMSTSIAARLHEIALLGLRGTTRGQRWWLAVGETVLMIIIGATMGFILGHATVAAVAFLWLGDAAVAPSGLSVMSAAITLLAAVVAVLAAQAAAIRHPVSTLLRRVPPRAGRVRSASAEALVFVVAVVAVLQLHTSDELTGLGALVPGLVVATLALVATRAVRPAASALARAGLRRGRLGWSLAGLHLVRRPGNHRLVVLVSVAVAMLGFSVACLDVSARARRQRAVVETGAATVVTLDGIEPRSLLAKVREADPDGAYAMAVAPVPSFVPALAVDVTRLATAVTWLPEFGVDPHELARLLHPPAPAAFVARTAVVTVEVDSDATAATGDARSLVASFEPLDGGPIVEASSGDLRPGRRAYRLSTPGCTEGCRLAGIRLVTARDPTGPLRAVLLGLRAAGPDTPVVTPADLADQSHWLGVDGTVAEAGPDGLAISGTPGARDAVRVTVVDAPYPLPVAATESRSASAVAGFDRGSVNAVLVSRPRMVPRLGSDAILIDLEYLDRVTPGTSVVTGAQVWLAPGAPTDAVARLRDAGLPVTATLTVDQAEALLAREGPVLVLWLQLVAAAFGVVLALGGVGLVATMDGRRQARDLRHLRRQGLSRRDVRRATLWGVVGLVLAGCVVAFANAWLAWLVVGDSVPLFADVHQGPTPPRWPTWPAVTAAWLAASAALTATSLALAGRTLR